MSLSIVRGATVAVWVMLQNFDRDDPDRHLCDRIVRLEATSGGLGSGVVRVQVGLTGPSSARDLTDLTLLTLPMNLQDGWEIRRAVALDGHTVQFTLE